MRAASSLPSAACGPRSPRPPRLADPCAAPLAGTQAQDHRGPALQCTPPAKSPFHVEIPPAHACIACIMSLCLLLLLLLLLLRRWR